MTKIKLINEFELNVSSQNESVKQIQTIENGKYFSLIEVNLPKGSKFPKHKAKEPITVLCLEGQGEFYAGIELEEKQILKPGTLIGLEPEIQHEVVALTDLRFLITKYKDQKI